MTFKNSPKNERLALSRKANETKRSPELKWAWANADKIIKERETKTITQLVKKYKISERSLYRVLGGK